MCSSDLEGELDPGPYDRKAKILPTAQTKPPSHILQSCCMKISNMVIDYKVFKSLRVKELLI